MLIEYIKVFALGGALCAIGQILIDKTKLTPARILTVYVVAGLILEAVGLYSPLVKWAGAGATVPLTGFGSTLAKGVEKTVSEVGVLGAFTGGRDTIEPGDTVVVVTAATGLDDLDDILDKRRVKA